MYVAPAQRHMTRMQTHNKTQCKVYAECDSKCDTSEFQFLSCSGEPHWPGRFIELELRPVSGIDNPSSSRERKLDLNNSVKIGLNGDGQT